MRSNWTKTRSGLIVWNNPLISVGEQDWSSRLNLSPEAQKVLSPPHFQPTTGTEYRLGILPGYLFPDDRRSVKKVRVCAQECTFSGWRLHVPHLEVTALARDAISDNEIQAIEQNWLIFMHLPVLIDGDPLLLYANGIFGSCYLNAEHDGRGRGHGWIRESGFAFVISRVNPED